MTVERIEYKDLMGKPYVKGGVHPHLGLDCAGISILLLRRRGIEIPLSMASKDNADEVLAAWASALNTPWEKLPPCLTSHNQTGDVVVFKGKNGLSMGVIVNAKQNLVATAIENKTSRVLYYRQLAKLVRGIYRWKGYA